MKKIITLITLCLLFTINTSAVETVHVSGEVKIRASIEEVFKFTSDPMNDHLWRKEVNEMMTDSRQLELGSVFREDAWIGIRPHFITTTQLVEFEPPYRALFETVKSNPYYLQSDRSFKESGEDTIFSYNVYFDKRMIKETFGFNAKPEVVVKLYGLLMKGYLAKLKRNLEN